MEQQLRAACSELGRSLRSDQPCSAEQVLAAHPEFAGDSTAALEIIYTEFVVREELGQKPTPANWYARFPQWRTDLEELFQVHEFVVDEESRISQAGGSTMRRIAVETVSDDASPRLRREQVVRGYEIGEELGRGGMGIVYKARQVSLNRLVALKMILAGEYATSEELVRFRSEATANAAVQHPNIVQIFEVGEQDGHAFLAQEYVPGGSLQRKLAEWQADGTVGMAPKSAAGLLLVLSRAVHYAHQRGIVHRNLKPANILLSSDGLENSVPGTTPVADHVSFVPKIADFGLAKMCHSQDAQVTHSGAILGTPSYMAPEQAAGQSAEIGVATDVYALGAILYELLTGRPPFRGTSIMETLEQVRRQDPVRPSRLQPSIPRDLETICLKCLQKDCHRRYASAAALADDLNRFLNGKSIVARPSSTWERAVKWSARQPMLAALFGVSTTAVVMLAAGALFSNAALRSANDRERERSRQADHQRKVAEMHREKAELHQEKAERHYRSARELVDRLSQVGVRLADQPRVEKMQREVLQQALEFYQQMLKEKSTDPEIQFETALAGSRVGAIQYELGHTAEALASYEQSAALLRELIKHSPTDAHYCWELATCLRGTGMALTRLQRHVESERMWREAVDLFGQLAKRSPKDTGYALMLANSMTNRCVSFIALNRFTEAEQLYERAISLQREILAKSPNDFATKRDLALSYDDLGELYWIRRQAVEAEQMCRQSYDMRMQLWKMATTDLSARSFLARSCRNLGKIYSETGRMELAKKHYEQSIELLERLRDEHLDVPSYAIDLAHCYRRRGIIVDDGTDYAKATQEYRRILQINPAYAPINNSMAWHFVTAKNPNPRDVREAVALAKKAVSLMPDASTYWNTLGVAHYRMSEWNEAVAALQKSIQLDKNRDISNWFVLALTHHQLGDAAQARRWLEEGLNLLENSVAPSLEVNRFRDEALAVIKSDSAPAPTSDTTK